MRSRADVDKRILYRIPASICNDPELVRKEIEKQEALEEVVREMNQYYLRKQE